jgi:hypothetical protein
MESFGWVLTAIILASVCFRKNCGQARQEPLTLRNFVDCLAIESCHFGLVGFLENQQAQRKG